MPFTPSHAVVALPFVRTPLVPAAIAIGAMTPDLPLYLRGLGPSYGFTHAPANLVWTTLIAAALLLIWRAVLRPASVELLPAVVAGRLPAEWRMRGRDAVAATFLPRGRWTYPLLVVLSLVLGVLSHIVWDLFTHDGRWGVEAVPLLADQWGPMPGYRWLQHVSSAAGLLIVAVFALLWLRRRPVVAVVRRAPTWLRVAWWVSLPAVLAAAWLVGLAAYGPLTAEFTAQHLAYRVLPAASGLWGAATLVLCAGLAFTDRDTPGVRP